MKIEFFEGIRIPDCGIDGSGIDKEFLARYGLEDDYCEPLREVLVTNPTAARPSVRFFADTSADADGGVGGQPPVGWLLGFGKAPPGWTPKDAYPDIIDAEGLLAAALKLTDVELWYSSVDFQEAEWTAGNISLEEAKRVRAWAQSIAPHWPHDLGLMRAGLNFTGKATLLPDLDGHVRKLLGLNEPTAVSGAVGLDDHGVFVELGRRIADASWPLLDGKLAVTITGLRLRASGLDRPGVSARPSVTLLGRLGIGGKSVKVTLSVYPGASTVGLLAEVEERENCQGWLESLVPDLKEKLSPLAAQLVSYTPGLQRLHALVPLRGSGGAQVNVTFGYDADLTFFDGLVQVRPTIAVATDFTKDGTSVTLSGYWIVGSGDDQARFDVSASLPRGDISLTLASGYRLKLADKLESLLAATRKGQFNLEVIDLDLEGNVRDGTFTLDIQTFGYFTFDVCGTPVKLGDVGFGVEVEEPGEWQVDFEALLTIGRYHIRLSASVGKTMEFAVLVPSVSLADLAADLFKIPPPAELGPARIEHGLLSLSLGEETRFELSARSTAVVTIGGVAILLESLKVLYHKGKEKPLTLKGAARITFDQTAIALDLSYESGTWRLGGNARTNFDLGKAISAVARAMGFESPFGVGTVTVQSFTVDLRFGDAGTRMAIRCDFRIDGNAYHLLLIAEKPVPDPETEDAGQPAWTHFLQIGTPPLDFFKLPIVGTPLKSVADTARQATGARDGTSEARLDNLMFRLAGSFERERIDALFKGLDTKDFPPPGALGGRASVHTDITLLDYRKTLDYPAPPKVDLAEPERPEDRTAGQGPKSPSGKSGNDEPNDGKREKQAPPPSFAPPAGKDRGWWLPVDRSIGPVTIDRVGIATDIATVSFLIDASAKFGPVKLALLGLEAKTKVKLPIAPEFSMKGVIVGCTTDELAISGGLMKVAENSYAGSVMIGYGKVNLSAIGSYTEIPDKETGGTVPSIAIFAVLGTPLGGPPAFYVTGLAGGIGYNRSWSKVPLDAVATHPMVLAADKGAADNTAIALLDKISPPRKGDHWVAIGVKFTSFKIINGVGVLVLALGEETRVGLMAKLDLTFPPKLPGTDVRTLIHAEILLQAEYRPAVGELKVNGMLAPKSFLLDEKAEITGGFALYCWFDPSPHAGDFVLTLGGYHPRFKVPAHYPKVERLALNWKVSDNVSIKGQQYFALTPAAVMAGGSLEVDFRSGWGRASFKAEADFIIYFQPFAYSARVGIAVHVEAEIDVWPLTLRLSFDFSVSLEIWGPPFGAIATVSFYGLTKDISIGDQSRPAPVPVTWADFRKSFLPMANAKERTSGRPSIGSAATVTDSLLTITASSGLVAKLDPVSGRQRRPSDPQGQPGEGTETDDWLIDPGALNLTMAMSIPAKRLRLGSVERTGSAAFGIGPMGIPPERLDVTVTIDIGGAGDWTIQETKGAVATGLWRPPGRDLPEAQTIPGVLIGAQLEPMVKPVTGCTPTRKSIPVGAPRRAWWVMRSPPKTVTGGDMSELRGSIAAPAVAARRAALIDALETVNADIAKRLAARGSGDGASVQPTPPVLRTPNGLNGFANAAQLLLVDVPQLSRWEAV